jgi:uncharacterized protein (TIGR03435 family)
MIGTAIGATAAAAISLAALGQTAGRRPPESPSFETASVKPAAPSSQRRVEENPETIILRNTTLKSALARAFGLKFGNQISGPSWIITERYDIVAKAPHKASAEQMRRMLQALLVERFKLVLHHENRVLPAYALLTKGRIKMHEVQDAAGPENSLAFNNGHREAKRMSMAGLARLLSLILNTPVVDMTALSSFYNFPFELSFEERGGMNSGQAVPGGEPKSNGSRRGDAEPLDSRSAPSVFTLVESLGLKLESRHMPFDVIVIDSGNKVPTEN